MTDLWMIHPITHIYDSIDGITWVFIFMMIVILIRLFLFPVPSPIDAIS